MRTLFAALTAGMLAAALTTGASPAPANKENTLPVPSVSPGEPTVGLMTLLGGLPTCC